MKKNTVPQYIRDIFSLLSLNALAYACAFITNILTARILGPEGRGVWALTLLVTNGLSVISGLGIGESSMYFFKKSPRKIQSLVANSLLMGVLSPVVFLLLFGLAVLLLKDRIPSGASLIILAAASSASIFLTLFLNVRFLFIGSNDIRSANLAFGFQSISRLVFIFVSLVIWRDVVTAVIANFLALVLDSVFALFLLNKKIGVKFTPDLPLAGETLVYGLKAHIAFLALYLIYKVDLFLVYYWCDMAMVGYYSIALSLSEIVRAIPEAFQTVLLSRLSSLPKEDDPVALTSIASRNSLVAGGAMAPVAYILSGFLIPVIFGKDFSASIVPFRLLLPGIVGLFLSCTLSPQITLDGKAGVNAMAAGAALAIMLIADFFLIPFYGIKGAAIGSSISYVSLAIIQASYFIATTSTSLSQLLIPRTRDIRRLGIILR